MESGIYIMRENLENLLKQELRALAITTRDKYNLTQREMSDKLFMTESSYSDIETSKYMCGTLTAILLLTTIDNPQEYLQYLSTEFAKLYEREMQPV